MNKVWLPKANLSLGWMHVDINKRRIHFHRHERDGRSPRINQTAEGFLHRVRKRAVKYGASVQGEPQCAPGAARE